MKEKESEKRVIVYYPFTLWAFTLGQSRSCPLDDRYLSKISVCLECTQSQMNVSGVIQFWRFFL